jgi:ribosomal protein L29
MKDLKEKNVQDIAKLLLEHEESLKNFRFGISGSSVRNVREGRGLRKSIARLKTELSARVK